MAVQEELVIKARAETADAEKGLARVAKEAAALEDAEKGLASGGEAASKALDDVGTAAKETEKKLGGAGGAAKEFSDEVDKAAKAAAEAKTQLGGVGAEAAKAGDKLDSASGGGKKFSEMLREVGDEADVAFGKFVEGIGGPGFVTALGTAGIAFAGVKAGVEAFVDSSEKLFRSYGPEGMAIWDESEKKIWAMQGAFAAAVLGGDDLNENAKRFNSLLDVSKGAVTALLNPLAQYAKAAWSVSDAFSSLGEKISGTKKAEDDYTKAIEANIVTSREIRTVYAEVEASNRSLLYSKKELAALDLQENITKIDYLILLEQEQMAHRANEAGKLAAAKADYEATNSAMREALKEAASIVAGLDPADQAISNIQDIANEILERDKTFQVYRAQAMQDARRQAVEGYSIVSDIEKHEISRLLDMRENAIQQAAEMELPPLSPAIVTTPTTRGTSAGSEGPVKEAEQVVYAFRLAAGGYAELTKSQADFLLASEEMLGDSSSRIIEMSREDFTNMDDLAQKVADNDAQRAADRVAHFAEGARKAQEELTNFQVAEEERVLQRAEKLKKELDKFWSDFGDSSKALGLQNMQDALAGIGTTLGSAARSGEDFGDALGSTMEALVGQIAGQWGDLFLKQGIGLMFLDPVAGAGLLAAGLGLKALSGFMSGGDSTTDTGTTGASGVQPSAVASTSVARSESSFGYFEGGRSPVTIVTNDAASIRTMQSRLNFVAARGGSGV